LLDGSLLSARDMIETGNRKDRTKNKGTEGLDSWDSCRETLDSSLRQGLTGSYVAMMNDTRPHNAAPL
jgi:hypothetical protein